MTSSKLTILRRDTRREYDSVFRSFEPFSIDSHYAAILDAVTLHLHTRNEQVNLSVVELQYRLSVSFFLNSQLLAFSFFFFFLLCFAREILSYLACTRHAPTDEIVKEQKSRERRSCNFTPPRSRYTSKMIRRNWETFPSRREAPE